MNTFTDVAELHEQAYQAFSRMDAREHPAPLAPRWWQTFNFTMVIYAVALGSSFILSSLSTGSVVSDSAKHFLGIHLAALEAVLSVLTLELVFSGTRFVMIFTDYKLHGTIPDSHTWMKAGFWLSCAMILLTNLYFRLGKLEGVSLDIKNIMDVILGFMLAIAVPIMAFVSGDVLAILYITGDKARKELVDAFNTIMTAYIEGRQRRWIAKKREFGISDKLSAARARLSAGESTHEPYMNVHEPTAVHESTHERRVNLRELAIKVHEQGDGNLSAEDMMRKYKISRGGTTKVRTLVARLSAGESIQGLQS